MYVHKKILFFKKYLLWQNDVILYKVLIFFLQFLKELDQE